MKKLYRLLAIASLSLMLINLNLPLTFAQNIDLTINTGYKVSLKGLGPTVCGTSSTKMTNNPGPIFFLSAPDPASFSSDIGTYHIAEAGVTQNIILDIPYVGGLSYNNVIFYRYGIIGGPVISETNVNRSENAPDGYIRFEMPVTFETGTQKAYLQFYFVDGTISPTVPMYTYITAVPITVLGPTINNQSVEILDTITEPQIPYLVLHAPPGDGSKSEFVKSKTTCRKLETRFATDESNAAKMAVKIGIAGEAGLFVTTEFEFSVTVSAGLKVGEMNYISNADETCITVKEGFETSKMLDEQGGGDVFIGYGTDLALGIYEYYRLDEGNCTTVIDTGLVYAPVGDLKQFAKTKKGIEIEIAALEEIVADSLNLDPKTVNDAQNQIDVWNQVLTMNQENVNNPDNEPIGVSVDLDPLAALTREESIKVVETSTIKYEHYTNVNLGVSTKVEVGGSGFEGGYEFKASKRFGETRNQSDEDSKLIKYTLKDDDAGDLFKVQIVRDPMYGTPIFRVLPGSKSSCPYQAGYQRDQPRLVFADGSNNLSLENIPSGSTETFQVRICNDSNEPRTYYLKGNSNTNLNGTVIEGFGNNLFNTNDQGVEFYLIPANECLDIANLSIKQSNPNILDYENIELYLNVDCQPATAPITSSIFLDAHFVETTSVQKRENENISFSIVPNPSYGIFNIQFTGKVEKGQIYIRDLSGKTVIQKEVLSGERFIDINENNLSPGIYFLFYQSAGSRLSQKLVIDR